MTFQLRPYQDRAVQAAIDRIRVSISPILIDAAPAAGKSFMIGWLADALHQMSGGKKVLCLAPSASLVEQNFEKFILTGHSASIFSASAGKKSTRHFVIFGTPGTVKNAISRFRTGYCAVIVDEAHGLTPTIRTIIEAMRDANPNLRVIGLTGTPYNMGKGYIFREWPDAEPYNARSNGDDTTRDPYFTKCVYRVSAREMLDEKFITPMDIGAIHASSYDTSGIVMLPNGTLQADTVERAFVGHGRKTAEIVADVIEQGRALSGGIMYFASTVAHAKEVLASLPPANSALVTGDECWLNGRASNRKDTIKAYRDGKTRHLVSVGTLHTGFDVSHTVIIALLRYTESASLLQQILGRAWRLHDGKDRSLLLDYADNIERHFPDGDIYNPKIKAGKAPGDGKPIEAECPDCGHVNEFNLNPDYENYKLDKHGYCLDVFGEQVLTDFGPMAGHYGRRCFGFVKNGAEHERCAYHWTSKECPECHAPNDISARRCRECKAELIDPNEKLVSDFKALKRDPTSPQTDEVVAVEFKEGVSRAGNPSVRADWVTPFRRFSTWHSPVGKHRRQVDDWKRFEAYTDGGKVPPRTVSYVKEDTGFYRILAFEQEVDTL